jgi:hypothetical protein
MRSSKVSHLVGMAFVLTAGAAAPMGCGSEPGTAGRAADLGTIALPLVTQTQGHTYRLSNVFISISGPQFAQLFSSTDPNETSLSTTLQTGGYSAFLFFGWTLERDDGTGNFTAVAATLVSNPVVNFTIFNGATSSVSYQFETDGVIVMVGAGQLKVTASVNEIAAVCTPFGTDCPEGSWCPPTALTGSRRACIAAGTTALGQPCAGPADCVGNASCFDLGTGPVCAALCPAGDFDAACASGGTCQPAGPDYGVCRPSALNP